MFLLDVSANVFGHMLIRDLFAYENMGYEMVRASRLKIVGLVALCSLSSWLLAQSVQQEPTEQWLIGLQKDGRILVPTNQVLSPAGEQLTFPSRPVDLAVTADGHTLIVKGKNELIFVDVHNKQIIQTLKIPKEGRTQPGFSVVGLALQGDSVYASDAKNLVRVAKKQPNGRYQWAASLQMQPPDVGGDVHPAGMAWQSKQQSWVTSTRGNNIQLIDVNENKVVAVVPVGVAPFTLQVHPTDHVIYVSNWGGDPPRASEAQGVSSDSPIRIDQRTGVANHGSVSRVEFKQGRWQQVQSITVGLHPSGMASAWPMLFVANAHSDTISVIDHRSAKVIETISCKLDDRLPFGSGPNALTLTHNGQSLAVANGTNNCMLIISLGNLAQDKPATTPDRPSQLRGALPTGWFPGAILELPGRKEWVVANIKGHGSLSRSEKNPKGMTSHEHLGSISFIPWPSDEALARFDQQVKENNRMNRSLAGLLPARPGVAPLPVPERHGEPSVFQHVLYIIKENRTYDQVFGDIKEGRGEPSLTIYGEEVTPNQHALARTFTLFDNFYCSGALSADGHTWVNEAYVGDYIERSFGGFTRSYPDDGSDPLAYSETGFLWDNALKHGKTFRNFGEYVTHTSVPKNANWFDYYADYVDRSEKVQVTVKPTLARLVPYTHPKYTWWPPVMPDVYRARIFIDELQEYERTGQMPNLIYLTLPCNHAMGTRETYPTPRAMVADNDVALGQIVEAVSKSRFWPSTCIFVVEDDPQDGFDHIDAHRTVAQVISPYTKRQFVDRTNYNQTGMVKTIELILGLPPMNQLDLSATPMRHCFQSQPHEQRFVALPNRIPLDERNPAPKQLKGEALYWSKKSWELDLNQIDAAEEDVYNRILWFAAKGNAPYPFQHTRQGRSVEKED